jgi:hypothetical protein
MDLVNITTMLILMAMIYPVMSAHNHNPSPGRVAEFEYLLAEIFRQAGWRVDQQPKVAESPPDLVAKHGGKRYVIELKVSSEGRKDRAVPLISEAILEVQLAARAPVSGSGYSGGRICRGSYFGLCSRTDKTVCATKCAGRGNRNH